ncbi:MAG: carboxylating nicotinate-nucleotide diphosphorylase [Acidobacteria bacterium]|nr:carboxylating nicotinate-nucleotide diphosphorylase [Acidobacteriota bacterium]
MSAHVLEGAEGQRRSEGIAPLYPLVYEDVVRRALVEDLGRAGDLTSDAVIPSDRRAQAVLVARKSGVVAGLDVAASAFRWLDPELAVKLTTSDGTRVGEGTILADIAGPARSLLSAERTALNFLGHLSGIATVTRGIVDSIAGSGARVVCTRKTTPGLRALEKHAVRCGGGSNHRFGLDDAVMIKDNHRLVAGGLSAAVDRVRGRVGHMVKIEVEVDTLEQLDEALALDVDVVLLDNMGPDRLREAVARIRSSGRAVVSEASGGITPETAPAIAATGVDLLSVGWITHSAPNLDVALDVTL